MINSNAIPLILFFLGYHLCSAQVASYTYDEEATYQYDQVSAQMVLRVSINSVQDMEGTPYLQQDWTDAIVYDHLHKKRTRISAKFNAYTKEIEFLKGEAILALKPVGTIEVQIGDIVFKSIKVPGSNRFVFAQELVQGNMDIMRYYDTKIVKAASDSNLLGIEAKDRLNITSKLFYREGDNEAWALWPKSKKEIHTIINDSAKRFAKKNKLSLKRESDLIEIIKKHNEG